MKPYWTSPSFFKRRNCMSTVAQIGYPIFFWSFHGFKLTLRKHGSRGHGAVVNETWLCSFLRSGVVLFLWPILSFDCKIKFKVIWFCGDQIQSTLDRSCVPNPLQVLPGVKQKGQTHKGTLGAAKAAAVNASQELWRLIIEVERERMALGVFLHYRLVLFSLVSESSTWRQHETQLGRGLARPIRRSYCTTSSCVPCTDTCCYQELLSFSPGVLRSRESILLLLSPRCTRGCGVRFSIYVLACRHFYLPPGVSS